MTDFFEEGFLCTEIEKISEQCYKENVEYFSLCEKLNRYCVQLMPNLKFQNVNRQAALTVALFIRQVALYEGVIILSRKGMIREAKVLLRTLIENMFILVAVTKSGDNAELYYNLNYFTKQDALKKQEKFDTETFYQKGADKVMQELDKKIKLLKLKPVGIFKWATKAGLTDYYYTAYPVLSWTVHSSILDSAKLLKGISDKDIREVEWHPELDEVGIVLATVIECSFIGIKAVNQLFNLELEHEIAVFQDENNSIAKKTGLKH